MSKCNRKDCHLINPIYQGTYRESYYCVTHGRPFKPYYGQNERILIRQALDKYNLRVAKHLSDYMGWPYEEILTHIQSMPDNKELN